MAKQGQKKTNAQPIPVNTRIIIIGAGIAGLYTALQLSPLPVTIITSKPLGHGTSSAWAQGGIAAAIGQGDTPQAHAKDTITAGAGLVDSKVAELVTEMASDRILDLLKYGVPFDKDLEGVLQLSKEAAHSSNRIVRIKGDRAGAGIMKSLISAVLNTPSIQIIENTSVHQLSTSGKQINGVYLWPSKLKAFNKGRFLPAHTVVLATGGCGYIYEKTTNPHLSRGEGLAMAARAGAVIADTEFMQFHPTALDTKNDPAPLATEALRGEGAYLINKKGERFMKNIHPDAELAPRDIVALSVYRELKAERGAYLDCANTIGKELKEKFPTVYKKCKEANINPLKEPIPIAPAAHFHMGGVVTDANGRSTVDGLWACGEVACTGLHGANRLASNSLLEAIVFAKRISDDIKDQQIPTNISKEKIEFTKQQRPTEKQKAELKSDIKTIRQMMFKNVGVERNRKGLEKTILKLSELAKKQSSSEIGKNMIITASFIAVAAHKRLESRGCHFRSDHPKQSSPPKRNYLTLSEVNNYMNELTKRKKSKEFAE